MGGEVSEPKGGEGKLKKEVVGGWREGPPRFIRDGPALQLLFNINRSTNKRKAIM